ncbi:MAG: sporulation protein [Chloroflexi bacterium]|nr:sporulation protein [Chloroflexota bacterium]
MVLRRHHSRAGLVAAAVLTTIGVGLVVFIVVRWTGRREDLFVLLIGATFLLVGGAYALVAAVERTPLFKPRGRLTLRAPERCLPGESISFEIGLDLQEPEVRVRQVRVELVGEETYYVRETTSGPRGQTRTVVRAKDETFVAQTSAVMDEGLLRPGERTGWQGSLQVPRDATPSSRGKLVNIRWTLRAVADVPGRRDLVQQQAMAVLAPGQGNGGHESEEGFPEGRLALYLSSTAARPGEVLRGKLRLSVLQELRLRAVRVELVRIEQAGVRDEANVVRSTRLMEGTTLRASEEAVLDFALDVPPDAPPTTGSPHSALRWVVRGVLDRSLRLDTRVTQEIRVYSSKM